MTSWHNEVIDIEQSDDCPCYDLLRFEASYTVPAENVLKLMASNKEPSVTEEERTRTIYQVQCGVSPKLENRRHRLREAFTATVTVSNLL